MSDIKKVLFIIDHLKGGGAEIMLLNLADQLHAKGFSIHIILLLDINNYKERTSNFHLYCAQLTTKFVGGKLLIKKKPSPTELHLLNTLIIKINPSTIFLTVWYAYLTAQYINHPNLWIWSQGDILPDFDRTLNPIKFFRNIYKRILFTRTFKKIFSDKNIIVLNKDLEKKYLTLLENINIHVIYNGISESTISVHTTEKIWDICYVGRLSPSKQIEHAIYAYAQSNLLGKMVIVGDGDRKNKLIKLVYKLNLQDRIIFTGWTINTKKYIRQSKVLVLPSRTEGFGLVIGEALIEKTAVVAYNCSQGIAYQFYTDDMKRGLVETNNIVALKNALEDIIQHPYIIPANIAERYSMEKMTNSFIELIN